MALTDRLGGKVRSAMRRARRDGPLDVVYVLFNADGMGGTARSGIEQANALLGLGEGHRVRILSITRSGDATHYPLADGLEVTYLVDVRPERPVAVSGDHPAELAERESTIVPRSWDALYNALTDAAAREALGSIEADVLVTTTPELLAVVAQLAPADIALVHQEHRASSSRVNDLGALLQFAPRADVVVSLTESMSRWLAGRLGGAAPELQVIPNPLPSHPQPRSPLDQKTFVTAGRLAPEKQFEHVVDAFWRIHEQLPGWTLTIWGDGPRADNLAAQVRKLGLEDRVHLPGSTDDLAAEWARTSVAVLASRGEGYPLVLQEAMSAGVPPVSYDCPSGPREMITHDVDGLLVPPASKAALAAAMLRIATDDDLRSRIGAAARSSTWRPTTSTRRSRRSARPAAPPTRSSRSRDRLVRALPGHRGQLVLALPERRDVPGEFLEQEPRRIEQGELGRLAPEHRLRGELAAEEAEHVAVAGVAAGDPDRALAGDTPDDGQEVQHQPEQPCPAVVDPQRAADELGDERFERALDVRRRHLVGRELVLERRVAEPTGEDAPVRRLLPVVEAVPAVVRAVEDPLGQRLGGDHLAAGRDDQPLDLAQQAARVAVGGDEDEVGVDVVRATRPGCAR